METSCCGVHAGASWLFSSAVILPVSDDAPSSLPGAADCNSSWSLRMMLMAPRTSGASRSSDYPDSAVCE